MIAKFMPCVFFTGANPISMVSGALVGSNTPVEHEAKWHWGKTPYSQRRIYRNVRVSRLESVA